MLYLLLAVLKYSSLDSKTFSHLPLYVSNHDSFSYLAFVILNECVCNFICSVFSALSTTNKILFSSVVLE